MLDCKQINIVWIVNDLYVNNFITVYNECLDNKIFKLTLVAAPHLGNSFVKPISSSKIQTFLKKRGLISIDSYDIKNNKFMDIKDLNPDYIFTTTPYDIYLPEIYQSSNLSKIAKLCNVHYGAIIVKDKKVYKDTFKNSFYKNTWNVFTPFDLKLIKKNTYKSQSIGYLKLDDYLHYGKKYNKNSINKNNIKIIWKPRWTIDQEDSNLFKYILNFYKYIKKNNNIKFTLLIHPLLISNLANKKLLTIFNDYLNKLKLLPNFAIENSSDYLDSVLNSDILIADHSSTIAEFTITGKPIIYTKTNTELNRIGKRIINNTYQTQNFIEITQVIQNLISEIDPLKNKRLKNKNSYFTTPPNNLSVALYLLNILYKDFNQIN